MCTVITYAWLEPKTARYDEFTATTENQCAVFSDAKIITPFPQASCGAERLVCFGLHRNEDIPHV